MADPRVTAGLTLPGAWVIPPFGQMYFGADDARDFTTSNGIETELGRRMSIRRLHFPFGNGPGAKFSWPTAEMIGWTSLTNPKVVPMIAHGSQGTGAGGFPVKTAGGGYSNTSAGAGGKKGIDRFTAGEWDSQYLDVFTRMQATGGPWIFNLWMEMDAPAMGAYGGYQGGVSGAGQAAFIAAYRHIMIDLYNEAGATNVVRVWCPTAFDPDNNKLSYYPGDDAVDWIMEDVYRQEFTGNVDDIYNFSVAHLKPFGIAESGFYDAPQGNQPKPVQGMVADWVASMNSVKYANTLCWIPWNNPPTKNFTGNLVDSTAAGLAAYKAAANSAPFAGVFFTGGGGPGPGGGSGTVPVSAVNTDTLEVAGTITGSESTPQNYEDEFAVRCFFTDHGAGFKYVCGQFTKVGSAGHASQYVLNSPTTRNHIYAENLSTGGLDAWNPNADNTVWAISPVNPSGKLYVAGEFGTICGSSRNKVALINRAGSTAAADGTFLPPAINGRVTGLDYDSVNGWIYISGNFTTVGGSGRAGLAALDAATGALLAWNPGVSGSTADCRRVRLNHWSALDADAYVAGEWTAVNGVSRLGVAALDATATTASPAVRSWNPDLTGTAATTKPHDIDFNKTDGSAIFVATAGSDASGDGNHGIRYTIVQGGFLNRNNGRDWTTTAQGDGGDHNACAADGSLVAFGHHGDGVQGTSTANNGGLGNRKVYIVNQSDGSPAGWIPTVQPNSVQGTYALVLDTDRFLIGSVYTTPRQGSLEYARTSTGPGGGGTPPSDVSPPTLSDTTPAVGEAISVISGTWLGNPTPLLTDKVQIAASLAAANLDPIYATGANFDPSGFLIDDSGNGWNGQLVTGTGGAAPSQVAGPGSVGGHAINFDGSGSRIEVPQDGSLTPPEWSIAGWIKLANPPGDTDPVHQRYELCEVAGWAWLNVRYDTSTLYVVRIGGFFGASATFDNMDSQTPLVPGTFAHVVGTYDGSNMRIYINTALDVTQARTGATTSSKENLVIGSKHRQLTKPELIEGFMHGAVTLQVFDHALTQSQINTLATVTFPIFADVATPYTPVSGDLGKVLRARESATNASGSAGSVGVPSAAIAGSSGSPVNTTLPSLSDTTPQSEQLITFNQGVWTGNPTTITDTIQIAPSSTGPWVAAAPAGQPYTVQDADVGSFLRVLEVATNTSGAQTVVSSASSSVITSGGSAPPSNTVAPTLSPDTVTAGVVITANQGTWVGATGTPTYEFQERDTLGGAITTVQAASSTATYTPSGTDFEIRVKVVRSNTNGSTAAFSDWAAPPVPYSVEFDYPHPSALGPSVLPSPTIPVALRIAPNPSGGVLARLDTDDFAPLADDGPTGGANGEHAYSGVLVVNTANPSPHNLDVEPLATVVTPPSGPTITAPTEGATVTNPVTVTWDPVS